MTKDRSVEYLLSLVCELRRAVVGEGRASSRYLITCRQESVPGFRTDRNPLIFS